MTTNNGNKTFKQRRSRFLFSTILTSMRKLHSSSRNCVRPSLHRYIATISRTVVSLKGDYLKRRLHAVQLERKCDKLEMEKKTLLSAATKLSKSGSSSDSNPGYSNSSGNNNSKSIKGLTRKISSIVSRASLARKLLLRTSATIAILTQEMVNLITLQPPIVEIEEKRVIVSTSLLNEKLMKQVRLRKVKSEK